MFAESNGLVALSRLADGSLQQHHRPSHQVAVLERQTDRLPPFIPQFVQYSGTNAASSFPLRPRIGKKSARPCTLARRNNSHKVLT